MSKGWPCVAGVGICGVVGVVLYMLFQLMLAMLIVNGTLPEERIVGAQMLAGAISALLAGVVAWGITGWRIASAATSLAMSVLVMIAGFLIYDGVVMNVSAFLRLGAMLLGGSVFSLIREGKRGGRKGRKWMGHKSGRRK